MSARARLLKSPSPSQPRLNFESRKRKKSKDTSPTSLTNPPKKQAMEETKAATSAELDAMEEHITTKLGDQIDRSLKEAVNSALEKLIESNRSAETHPAVKELAKDTRKVVTKVNRIESEQTKLKRRIQDLEKRVLENILVLRGVKEDKWEEEKDTLRKVYQEISHLMDVKEGEDSIEVAHE